MNVHTWLTFHVSIFPHKLVDVKDFFFFCNDFSLQSVFLLAQLISLLAWLVFLKWWNQPWPLYPYLVLATDPIKQTYQCIVILYLRSVSCLLICFFFQSHFFIISFYLLHFILKKKSTTGRTRGRHA